MYLLFGANRLSTGSSYALNEPLDRSVSTAASWGAWFFVVILRWLIIKKL